MLVVHLALLLAVSTYARAAIADVPLYLQRIAREEYASDNKDIYIAHVHIGNPASTFNLTLDLNYYESLLIGAGSTPDRCSTAGHRGFNMRQVPFGVISRFEGAWDPRWASDGLLGLVGPDSQFAGQPGTAKALAQKNGNPVVAWYHNGKRVVGEEAGKIAFGSLPEACSRLQYATPYFTNKRQAWNFRVNGAALGGAQTNKIGAEGFFDYSTSILLRLPEAVFDSFAAEIKAKEDPGTGIYYVDCERAAILPNLNVTLDGLDDPLVFSYKAYIDLMPNQSNDMCEVRLRWETGIDVWTFGNRLWENYCVALNYDTGYVGFSRFSADV
ncbi:Peptidase A1 [Aphelenchoides avenae]|nr:Peptidase A1 [Aphelenchus avenae]